MSTLDLLKKEAMEEVSNSSLYHRSSGEQVDKFTRKLSIFTKQLHILPKPTLLRPYPKKDLQKNRSVQLWTIHQEQEQW